MLSLFGVTVILYKNKFQRGIFTFMKDFLYHLVYHGIYYYYYYTINILTMIHKHI